MFEAFYELPVMTSTWCQWYDVTRDVVRYRDEIL
jgi:hypothetical protein